MKNKIIYIVSIILCLGIGIGIGFLINNKEEESKSDIVSIYDIEPIVKEYLVKDKRTIYLYNTNEVMINNITLKEYINKYKKIDDMLNSIESNLEIVKVLKDGGTTIYKNKDNTLFDKDLTIVKCHTNNGNEDLYFGEYMDTTEAFQNGACGKSLFNEKNFQKVYTITKIKELSKDQNNYNLEITIKDDNDKEITINRVVDEDSKKVLKEKQKFIFYFENKYSEYMYDDIDYIFTNCDLTGVVPYKES